ncbi:hypothetical protein D9M71_210090 [compost metagenome]
MEPAAVLVGAFQIEIGSRAAGMAQLGMGAAQHVPMGGTGVEPDVQSVADLVVLASLVAKQLGGVQLEPGLDAFLLDALGHFFHQLDGARVQLTGGLVQEERDRYAPVALARDAPVRAAGDHAVQACLAPGGNEFGLVDGGQGAVAQRGALLRLFVHADEPLRSGAVDQRSLVAPAMHVAVADDLVLEQRAHFFQLGDDGRVGLPDELTAEERQVLHIHAVALNGAEDVVVAHAVLFAGTEVVLAVGRRGVDDAGTGAQFDILGQVDGRQALVEGVAEADQVQRFALGGGDDLAFQAVARKTGFHQLFGQHQQARAGIHQRVVEFGVDVQGLVGRNGPGGSGPDDDGGRLGQARQAEGRSQLVGVFDREGHVDGVGLLVGVLHLGLSQGRAAIEAPIHRLQALEHEAVLDHLGQGADLACLVGEGHGLVGVAPVAQHAQADEVGLLALDLLGGVGTAQLAGLVRGQVLAMGGLDLVLDRQAVAVPARHVGGVVAGQGLGTDDDVLEDLVDRVTDVNAAVGVGRAIVQDELRATFADLPQLAVQIDAVPALQQFRLALGQTGLHRECRLGQVQGRFVIGHFSPGSSI